MELAVQMTSQERAKFFKRSRQILRRKLGKKVSVVDGVVRKRGNTDGGPLWFVIAYRNKQIWRARIREGEVEFLALMR